MITLVKITQVIGQFQRFGRGPGILMRGEIDDGECQIPVHGFLQTFPLGLVNTFLIGQEVSCLRWQWRTDACGDPAVRQPAWSSAELSDQHPGSPRQRGGKARVGRVADAHAEQSNVLPRNLNLRPRSLIDCLTLRLVVTLLKKNRSD